MTTNIPSEKNGIRSLSLDDRVYLERIRMFYGHGVGNMISAAIGGVLLALVLGSAGIQTTSLMIWFFTIVLFAGSMGVVERLFSKSELTIENAKKWIYVRAVPGLLVMMMYGASPFLLPEYTDIYYEMYILFILLSAVAVGATSFTVMPRYYLLMNSTTMVPLTLYFAFKPDMEHFLLAVAASIWQIVVLSKALQISKSAIGALYIVESYKDEIRHHEETRAQLQQMATHDSLTGLPNRNLLVEHIDELIKQGIRHKRKFALMLVDLDGFKDINDSHGHDAGDRILIEVAKRLKLQFRDSDTIARMGGDEFILVYTDIQNQERDISVLVERTLESIRTPISLSNDLTGQVSGSIGIALFPDHGDSPDELIKAADNAMYSVKARGKNGYAYTQS